MYFSKGIQRQEHFEVHQRAPLFELLQYSKVGTALYNSSGIEHPAQSASVNQDWKRFIPNLQKCFSKAVKRESWEEPLLFLRAPPLIIWKVLERLLRELKAPKALKFITISFLMSWLCNNSRNEESFGFIARVEDQEFQWFSLGWTHLECKKDSLPDRLNLMGIVSHSILTFFARRKNPGSAH